jgi:parvulin-like peptidyl-prolyl isomerase
MAFMNILRAAGAAVLVAALTMPALSADVVQQIIVKVNGEIFTKTDLEQRQVQAVRQLGANATTADPSDAELRRMLNESTPQLIVGIVDEMLIVQRGQELGYRMGDEQFNSVIDNIKKENKIENDEQFQAALKQENMTMAELRKNLERQMIITRVQQNEVMGKVSVSDEEARAYYDAHLSEFTTPQTVTLREIFVTIPNGTSASVADDTAAREKAQSIRARALAGESFEKLASDLSDSPSRANGGLVGPLSLNDLSNDLKTMIGGMKAGDITEALRGPRGYQILKLETKSEALVRPFAEARDDISNRVFTGKRQAEFQKYLEKLRSEAIIEWKSADVKTAYDQGLEQEKAKADAAEASSR